MEIKTKSYRSKKEELILFHGPRAGWGWGKEKEEEVALNQNLKR